MKSEDISAAFKGADRCRNCGVRSMVLFADLDESDFNLIHAPIDDMTFEQGHTLYTAGDPGDYLYTVRSGMVKLLQYLPDGSQRIVRLLRQGDIAGLETVLGGNYQHTAVTLSAVQVCRIPQSVIQRLNTETPRLHGQLMSRWQRALEEADVWLTELSTGTARARVLRLLLRLAEAAEGEAYQLLSREDIGAMLGITTETASRMIAEFKRNGLIAAAGPNMVRADIEKLRAEL